MSMAYSSRSWWRITLVAVSVCCLWLGQSAFAGSIVGWGANGYGQTTPPDGNDFVAIAAGGYHSLALKSDGSIVGWGSNDQSQATPPAGSNFVAIAACERYSLALKSDGSIVGWGDDYYGQTTPPGGNDFVAIAAGSRHSLALKADGSIVGWGSNYMNHEWFGQATPPAGNDFVAIAAGNSHTLALKSDGSIVGWGGNWKGEATPPDGNDFVAIAAAGATLFSDSPPFFSLVGHSLALKSDGSIVGWGSNDDGMGNWVGQATPPDDNDFVAIAAAYAYPFFDAYALGHGLALWSDGSIVGWGSDEYGQATPPDGNDFVAIAAGDGFSLAIRESGPGELTLIQPNGGEKLIADRLYTIEWQSSGSINQVLIEYSDSNGVSWTPVSPANAGNNRRYNWLVPNVNSEQCLVRISDAGDPVVSDVSDAAFTIYQCTLPKAVDPSGDCRVDFADYALIASYWLECGNPFDPSCAQ